MISYTSARVNPQCLFAGNIIELNEFNKDKTQQMHQMLVDMDAKELQTQIDETLAEVNHITNRRWTQAYSVGSGAMIGAVAGLAIGAFVVGMDMYWNGKSFQDVHKDVLWWYTGDGAFVGGVWMIDNSSKDLNFDRQRLDRLQAKINTLSHKMKAVAEMPENDKRQLEISNTYFLRLLSHHEKLLLVKKV